MLLGPLRAVSYLLIHGLLAASLASMWKLKSNFWLSILVGAAVRMAGQVRGLELGAGGACGGAGHRTQDNLRSCRGGAEQVCFVGELAWVEQAGSMGARGASRAGLWARIPTLPVTCPVLLLPCPAQIVYLLLSSVTMNENLFAIMMSNVYAMLVGVGGGLVIPIIHHSHTPRLGVASVLVCRGCIACKTRRA